MCPDEIPRYSHIPLCCARSSAPVQDRPEDYEKAVGRFIIDKEIMKLLPKDSRVLHPLPRVDEVRLVLCMCLPDAQPL